MGSGVIRIALLLGVMVVVAGCPGPHDYYSPGICTDKYAMVISQTGGVDTVNMCSYELYDHWEIYKVRSSEAGENIKIYDPSLTDEYLIERQMIRWTDPMQMEDDWYRLYIPSTDLRSLVIDLKPNCSEISRELTITMKTDDGNLVGLYVDQYEMVSVEGVNSAE
ncbi:MAG: hypothetical protein II951_02160 [Bacteroidales bacterium]|nr:hypothetical protein [Bacteroidales bacterium]